MESWALVSRSEKRNGFLYINGFKVYFLATCVKEHMCKNAFDVRYLKRSPNENMLKNMARCSGKN